MRKATILFIMIFVIINISVLSCAPEVTDTGHDILYRELSRTQDEITEIHNELQETKGKLSSTQRELNTTQDKLSTTESILSDKLIELEETRSKLEEASAKQDKYRSDYEELSIKYEELKEKYSAIIEIEETVETVNEGEVEQALFKLVNQERKSNGLNELIWNTGLYSSAQSNNRNMSETKSLQHAESPSLQQVFWFLGYGTSDGIANATLTAWKNNPSSYNQNVLSSIAVNGAVAVYKAEEILYITFLCYTDIPYR